MKEENGDIGRQFLALLSEADRIQAVAIIGRPLDVGFREVAAEVIARWPEETSAIWGEWVSYHKGVGMDLVEAVQPGQAYA